jgi:carbamoylphosphate synthase large subunit
MHAFPYMREKQQQQALGEPKKMHGHQQNLKTMMMKIGQVMIVKNPFVQDQCRAIVQVKVKAVPMRRPMLSPRQSTREITGIENKKKGKKGSS